MSSCPETYTLINQNGTSKAKTTIKVTMRYIKFTFSSINKYRYFGYRKIQKREQKLPLTDGDHL